jgi:hypothetical protein
MTILLEGVPDPALGEVGQQVAVRCLCACADAAHVSPLGALILYAAALLGVLAAGWALGRTARIRRRVRLD